MSQTSFTSRDHARIPQRMTMLARRERGQRRMAQTQLVFLLGGTALVIAFELMMAMILFATIDAKVGATSLSGPVMALGVIIVALGLHLRIAVDEDRFAATWLGRLAGVGVFLFAFAIAVMVAAFFWEASEGLTGRQAQSLGTVGNQSFGTISTGVAGWQDMVSSWMGSVPRLLLFFGMGFSVIISFYVAHKLFAAAAARAAFLANTPDRYAVIARAAADFERAREAYERIARRQEGLRRVKPFDPETAYARAVFQATSREIQAMRRALRQLPPFERPDVMSQVLGSAMTLPGHIRSIEDGERLLDEIRDALRPHAIIGALKGAGGLA